MLGYGASVALLLLLVVRSSRTVVPPPANVTVSCQNFLTNVSWDYNQHQPQTRFKITIKGSAGEREEETMDHYFDLSNFIWESELHYHAFLYVTVAAVQGQNQSEVVTSNTFSFSDLKPADTKCSLEFPRVTVTVGELGAMVSFKNPIHFYSKLDQTVTPNSVIHFKFTIFPVRNGTQHIGEFDETCSSQEDICKSVVSLTEDGEKCFVLKGFLFDAMGINKVKFRETDQVCAMDSGEDYTGILAIVLTSVFVLIIIVLGLLICKATAWTMKMPKLPTFLQVPQPKEQVLRCDPGSNEEEMAEVSVLNPSKSLSVSSENSDSPRSHRSAGCEWPQRLLYEERRLSESTWQEGRRMDNDSANYSEKTESDYIESGKDEEEPLSAYEHRPTIWEDMGDGDLVMGYNGN